jgi:polyisoprenyl-teichoic acid--peptidoglycan teichoic acid transferase
MSRPRRTWPQRLLLSFNVLAMLSALALAWLLNISWEKTASISRVQLAGTLTPANPTTPGSRVLNILLVGSDSSAGLDPDNPIAAGRIGERNGDVIIIAHLDERDGTASLLSLPRDLWVPIAGTASEKKINSAFAIGGPATLIETIEEGFGIPINYYVNVDFAGFEGLVDAVGSVEVFFDTPARDWHPQYQRSMTGFVVPEAGCASLDPPMALAYVRSRFYQTQDAGGLWITDPSSDLGRIRRQQDFLQRLVQRAIDLGARNPFVLSDLIDTGLEHVAIDQELTIDFLLGLSTTYNSFEPGELETYSFPARFDTVGSQSVLIPLDAEAAPIVALFQGARSDDPSTVRVAVVHAPGVDGDTEGVVAALVADGFVVEGPSAATVEPGLVVRHGADGSQAAQLVAAALGPSARLEQVDGLLGRDVRVIVGSEVVPSVGGPAPSGSVSGPTSTTAPEAVATTDLAAELVTSTTELPTEQHAGCG